MGRGTNKENEVLVQDGDMSIKNTFFFLTTFDKFSIEASLPPREEKFIKIKGKSLQNWYRGAMQEYLTCQTDQLTYQI